MKNITIITGASSGIGKEFFRQIFAAYLKRKVASVEKEIWLIARDEKRLSAAKNEILAEQNKHASLDERKVSVKIFCIDLCGEKGVKNFGGILERESENDELKIELLVNNAGFGTYGEFCETDIWKQTRMIDLNCVSLTGICGICLPKMAEGAVIINVSSLAAFLPLGNFAVYAASKSYVLSFSLALAAELKDKKIRVCALCPGSVSTNFANVASNGARKEVLGGKPPEKIVKHCLKNAKRGRRVILYGVKWKITAFLSRFIPRYAGARFTFLFIKRPSNP